MVLDGLDSLLGKTQQRDIGRHGDALPLTNSHPQRDAIATRRSGEDAGLVVAKDLVGGPRAFLRTTFHEALKVNRAGACCSTSPCPGAEQLQRGWFRLDHMSLFDWIESRFSKRHPFPMWIPRRGSEFVVDDHTYAPV